MTDGITQALFLHGGPGANSRAEEKLLGPLFREAGIHCTFWNEPVPPKEGNAFEHSLASVRMTLKQLTRRGASCLVIAHSFASLHVLELLRLERAAIGALLLITPSTALFPLFRNVLRLAEGDLQKTDPTASAELNHLISQTQGFMDSPMRRGFEIAAQDRELFSHYWKDRDAMKRFYGSWSQEGWSFNLAVFIAVLDGLNKRAMPFELAKPYEGPTRILFGKHDPVVLKDEEVARARVNFPMAEIETLENSGHFPHIELPDRFMEACRDLAKLL